MKNDTKEGVNVLSERVQSSLWTLLGKVRGARDGGEAPQTEAAEANARPNENAAESEEVEEFKVGDENLKQE